MRVRFRGEELGKIRREQHPAKCETETGEPEVSERMPRPDDEQVSPTAGRWCERAAIADPCRSPTPSPESSAVWKCTKQTTRSAPMESAKRQPTSFCSAAVMSFLSILTPLSVLAPCFSHCQTARQDKTARLSARRSRRSAAEATHSGIARFRRWQRPPSAQIPDARACRPRTQQIHQLEAQSTTPKLEHTRL